MEFGMQVDKTGMATIDVLDPMPLQGSSRARVPTRRARESAEQQSMAFSAVYAVLATYFEPKIADKMADPIAFLSKFDPNTLYYHQAMKAPDAKGFCQAMQGKKLTTTVTTIIGHFVNADAFQRESKYLTPFGQWAMKQKRRIKTKEIYKWKARFNIQGSQQEYGVNYWEMFAPVMA
jgi:hypothetical protein